MSAPETKFDSEEFYAALVLAGVDVPLPHHEQAPDRRFFRWPEECEAAVLATCEAYGVKINNVDPMYSLMVGRRCATFVLPGDLLYARCRPS